MNNAGRAFSGRDFRLRRLLAAGRGLIVPLDHAITSGPADGLADATAVVGAAAAGGADAVLLRPGLAYSLAAPGADALGVIMMLTGRLIRGVDHVVLNSVEKALEAGADAVCGEFKFGSDGDLENVRLVSALVERAHQFGLPVLITVYTLPHLVAERGNSAYAHGCRVAEEMGADLIKTDLPDDEEVIAECLAWTTAPIVLAGGGPRSADHLADFIGRAVGQGIAGAAIGRNAWGAADPVATIRQFSNAVHDGNPHR